MKGDSFENQVQEHRNPLEDVSNRPRKRDFSLIGCDGKKDLKRGGDEIAINPPSKEVIDNILIENENGNEEEEAFIKGKKVCSGTDPLRENVELGLSVVPNESNEARVERNDVDMPLKVGLLRESSFCSITLPADVQLDKACLDDEGECEIVGEKVIGVDDMVSNKSSSIGCSMLPKSQGSKLCQLEGGIGLEGDAFVDQNVVADSLKRCSCSFCMKAGYIWSDLHYQDIKARIAAIKRSQKEASLLGQRSCRNKEVGSKNGQGSSNKSSKLEADLTDQWRLLFRHMEDVFACEGKQLETSYLALKELRENCKMDLETINSKPLDKQ